VVASDPMPPEVPSGAGGGDGAGGGWADSYDRLLERADRLAEGGNCSAAKPIYERALDANPSGVGALTGLGYCHIDGREFASAHAKFRAALGVSPRYQPALWGMAEMYQRQGLTDQAIEGYRRFLREHPHSRRADQARRQIERLGGAVEPEGPPSGASDVSRDPPAGPGSVDSPSSDDEDL
jgi:tetratricopeptide (TPR) repeat protein